MSKVSKPKKQKKRISASPISQMLEPFGTDGEIIDIEKSEEKWSEYILQDGTILRLKPAVIEIRRLKNQYTPSGEPIYFIKSVVVNDTKVNPQLKRK